MKLYEIREIIKWFEASSLEELEIETVKGESKLQLKRQNGRSIVGESELQVRNAKFNKKIEERQTNKKAQNTLKVIMVNL
ncbi:hypothetical protein AJ85_15855 [Alkalihalobacillus alcalophilus ATCC 27647 = CGMCC 1.3604]|uniref:Uncharacterized protein n=1 Tax=Alkalihalobacillus alcalophilus ATCC 27647 = CGMCC 1.3604 TaxID=1218173 RepID=A0A094YQ32_ALKAL|nr:hypothetical protein [Alkalihalobacillus alcalophilus]KGA95587.1 hypothetical protein BALCAV_0221685 [Alkalihalobacillus alcalophilus ATCC 27647 = CGMCC 1.3604]MED1562929.1 hypothetical protein [Alkalihalobacillus alcalophilus]THG89653.1 hypothetical protein AJ85_15855 [Alkalihalobacillus alcalophilus ATCC 27647 = CGMCC 1.3604]